jgi:creatinine amidohydrolase
MRLRFVSIFDLTPDIAARYREDAPDFHANEAETSMVLHLDLDQVRLDRAVDEPDRTIGRELQYAMPAVTASGVVGAPTTADASRGAELVEQLVEAFAALLAQVRAERDPEL